MHRPTHPHKFLRFRQIISFPFIWAVLIPIVVTDIILEIYHQICFPLYGLKKVKRSEYIRIKDREKLSYLSLLEKIHCAYCGYVNGWLRYAGAIAQETEGYWCAIMHLEARGYKPAEYEKEFAEYGDEKTFRKHSKKEGKDQL